MNNGKKPSEFDITKKTIHLNDSDFELFKGSTGKVKIVEHDSGCEFIFNINGKNLIQEKKKKNGKKTLEDKYKDFFDLLALDEGDEITFNRDDKNDCFVVNIKEKIGPNIASIDEVIKEKIDKVYKSIVGEYNKIFNEKHYLPTKISNNSNSINGFTERNLTFNFCHSYLNLNPNPNAIVWQEAPIINVNRQHIDSIIIDNDWVIYIEAKRFYDVHHFKYLLDDFKRIKKQHSNIPLPPEDPEHPFKKVVILLADHISFEEKVDEKFFYDKFFTSQEDFYQKDFDSLKIDGEKYPNLKKILPSMIKSNKISTGYGETITIRNNNKYNISNISIKDDIDYTIYCGVYFIE